MIVTEIGSIIQQYDQSLAIYAPLIANVIQLVATLASVPALKKYGRKNLILLGNFSLGIFDLIMGVMFLVAAVTGWKPAIYIVLVFILLFMISYGVTIGPIVWLYVPEIIPAKIVPVATFMNWFGCSICIIATPFVIDAVGSPYPVFFAFGAITLFFFIFNYSMLIETEGLTRKQIL